MNGLDRGMELASKLKVLSFVWDEVQRLRHISQTPKGKSMVLSELF